MIHPKKSSANIAYLVGSVIIAVMALAVFVGGANAMTATITLPTK